MSRRRAWVWIWICLSIAGLVFIACCLAFLRSILLPEWRLAQRRHEPEAVELVAAIETYHRDKGLWPQYVDDLHPEYLSQVPPEWTYYGPDERGYGPVVFIHGDVRSRLEYLFPPTFGDLPVGWRLVCEWGHGSFGESVTPMDPTAVSPEELSRRRIEELQRRIDREPDNEAHMREMQRLQE